MHLLTSFYILLVYVVVFGSTQVLPPYTEDCQHGLYVNHGRCVGMPPTLQVDLDQDPSVRWKPVIQNKQKELVAMIGQVKQLVEAVSPKIITALNEYLPELIKKLPEPYGAEIQGIAKISGLPDGEILLFNIFYEIFTVCTSIVAQDDAGKLYHGRNLDFGLFMGWDVKNHTWLITEYLKPLVVNVEFTKGGKLAYKSVNFAGYIGLLSGVKPNAFTITLNERFNIDGGFIGMLEWILGQRNGHWTSFLTRTVMEKADNYTDAINMLTKEEILAPVYYIVGGAEAEQGAVITRDRTTTDNVMSLNTTAGRWYVVETNYDNWKNPPFFDDRRTDAKKCLDTSGRKSIGFSSIYDILSTKPVLNQLTTYTALMQVNAGTLETYIRDCPHPCYPW